MPYNIINCIIERINILYHDLCIYIFNFYEIHYLIFTTTYTLVIKGITNVLRILYAQSSKDLLTLAGNSLIALKIWSNKKGNISLSNVVWCNKCPCIAKYVSQVDLYAFNVSLAYYHII